MHQFIIKCSGNSSESGTFSIQELIQEIRNKFQEFVDPEMFNKLIKIYFALYDSEKSMQDVKTVVIDKFFLISCIDELKLKFEIKSQDNTITFHLIPDSILSNIKTKKFDKIFNGRNYNKS